MKGIVKVLAVLLSLQIAGPALSAEKVYFYYTDPAGTPLTMTNENGAIVWSAEYKPFGEPYQVVTSGFENNRMFVSKEMDVESGLYYFGARYMEARIGRFMSPDPVGPDKPLLNPQGLNSYAYSANNPYRYIDPDGRAFLELKDYSQIRQNIVNNYLSWAPPILQEIIYPSPPSGDIGIGPMPLVAPAASAAVRGSTLPGKLFHYTGQGNAESILEKGLLPSIKTGKVFTTPTGTYSPIEAQMHLGLPPNQGLPGALIEIDTATLRSLGINPSAGPMRVLPTPNAMGYGTEFIFDQAIPPAALRQIPLK